MRFQTSWNDSIGFLKNTFEVPLFEGTQGIYWHNSLVLDFHFHGNDMMSFLMAGAEFDSASA